jgi:Putative MetA-pathway of phenol degradation
MNRAGVAGRPESSQKVIATGAASRKAWLAAALSVVLGLALIQSPSAEAEVAGGEARGVPKPGLKPLERDRSDQVIVLLQRAAHTTDASQSPAAPKKPRFKPDDVATRVSLDNGSLEPPTQSSATIAAPGPESAGGSDAIEQLRGELQSRDLVIANLLQRVEELERRIILTASQLDQAVGGAGPVSLRHRPVGGAEASDTASTPAANTPDLVEEDAGNSDDVQMAQAQPPEGQTAPRQAPGQFEIEEGAIDRALERTLVQEGVLLLPLGQAEIEPSFTYTRRELNVPTFVTQNGSTFVGEQEVKRDEFVSTTALRFGLPFDSQIEVGIPYNYVDESVDTTVGGATRTHNSEFGHGFGDLNVGLAKTLLQEGAGWWPDMIARVTWDADTGKTRDNGVLLGGGFNELSGSLSAVKRQDPLAFVGGVSYAKAFENDDIEPGEEVGFSLGTVLAASPETSLSFFFNQTFADDTKVDGDKINGSDQVIGTFNIGAATILGRNMLLSVTGEIGLTDDAPDYAIGASLPIRFDLPVY